MRRPSRLLPVCVAIFLAAASLPLGPKTPAHAATTAAVGTARAAHNQPLSISTVSQAWPSVSATSRLWGAGVDFLDTSAFTTSVTGSADLAVTLSASTEAVAGDPGGFIYTIQVQNNGPDAAQGVSLTDALPAGETFVSQSQSSGPAFSLSNTGNNLTDTIASLAASMPAVLTVTVQISSALPEGTVLTDTVQVTSNTPDPVSTNNSSSASTTVHVNADLGVTKTGPADATAGDPGNLTYTVTVTNNGPSDAQGVSLTDPLPPGETFVSQSQIAGPAFTLSESGNIVFDTISTLASGASATFSIVVSVPSSAPDLAVVNNTASVGSTTTDFNSFNNSSTASTTIHAPQGPQPADLSVTKTAATEAIAGDPGNLSYTITVVNNGPGDAQAVVLSDALPVGETLASQIQMSGPAFTLSSTATSISDTIATLPAGASASFKVVAHLSPSLAEGTALSNTATVASSTIDPTPANNASTASTTVHARADLAVTKTGPASAVAGDPTNLAYTITVTNNGPSDAQAVVLSDALPAGETFVSQGQTAGPAFTLNSNPTSISNTIATLAAGASASFTLTVHLSSSIPEGTVLSNTATVGSSTTDPVPANNASTASTVVHGPADLAVSKSGPAATIAGDPGNLSYTVTVVNNGPGDAQAVVLSDALPVGETFVSQSQTSGPAFTLSSTATSISDTIATLPAGATASFTVVAHVSPLVPEGTQLSNTATVSSTTPDSDPTNNASTASTLVHANADLAVSKTGPASTIAGDPANLTYTITVTNNGPSDAQAVVLSDPLPPGESFAGQSQLSGPAFALSSTATSISDTIATLAAGASASFIVTANVSASVPEGTVLSNTATVGSSTADPIPTNNASTASTLVHANADLAVSKTGPASAVAGDPGNLTYKITVTNNGPSDAQAVVLSDALPAGETFVSQSQLSGPAFTLSNAGNTVSDTIATLAAGASASFAVTANVSPSVPEGTVLSNTATASSSTADSNPNNNASTASTTIADARIGVGGAGIAATEGQPFSGPVATLCDPDAGSTAAEYTALITWGDGTAATPGTIVAAGACFSVTGAHLYAEEGTYTVKVSIADVDTPANSAIATDTANVGDAQLTSLCAAPAGAGGAAFNGPTATLTDASSTATASDFTATIDWGDGTTSAGTTTGGGGGLFTVTGAHIYTTFGMHAIKTTIADVGGQSTVAKCAPVFFFPPSTVPACDIESNGAIQATNGDLAVFADDVSPSLDADRGRSLAVVYVDLGPADAFFFTSTQILAATCAGNSATIYGIGVVNDGTRSVQVFFIEDVVHVGPGNQGTMRLQLFGAHPYDSGTQSVMGNVRLTSS